MYLLLEPTHPVQLSTKLGNPPTLPKGVRNMYTSPYKLYPGDFHSRPTKRPWIKEGDLKATTPVDA